MKEESKSLDGIVVGIYGISGIGKSHVLKLIAAERFEWRLVDGSQLIREALRSSGQTMEAFAGSMTSEDKASVRQAAIKSAKRRPGVTLVAGHGSCPITSGTESDEHVRFDDVFTPADGDAYDMIVCLRRAPERVLEQVLNDTERPRANHSVETIQMWMDHEEKLLREKCLEFDIVFDIFRINETNDYRRLIDLIVSKAVTPAYLETSRMASEEALVSFIEADVPSADVYLLIDGDGTLCPQDTGALFFDQLESLKVSSPLKSIFKRYEHYTHQAFWEAAMLYGNAATQSQYVSLCQKIGREQVTAYKAWETFLGTMPSHVHPIIVSSSIREVWLAMQAHQIEVHGHSSGFVRMSVIAGNNLLMHPYIVDDHAKALVAKTLRRLHGGCRIISFGDSALDVPMFHESDRAYVVVNEKLNRSMKDFIDKYASIGRRQCCWLYQLLDLCPDEKLKRWHNGLPVQSLGLLSKELTLGSINDVIDCASTSTTAQIIAATMRDANRTGPTLQEAHEKAGKFLADRLLDEFGQLMGMVESVELPHVQGGTFEGLASSASNIFILPLMRGGEPMSRGVYSRFPSAMLIHIYDREEGFEKNNHVLTEALERSDPTEPISVILVDSVINSGRSIKTAVSNIRKMAGGIDSKIKLVIYVLAGVMQHGAAEQLPRESSLLRARFVVLRVSKNKYTGRGGSDTGNRLFGTTLIE